MEIKKVIVVDDHPLFRSALSKCLSQEFSEVEIVQAEDMNSLQSVVQENQDADLLLLDLLMPGCLGFSGLLHVNSCYPLLPVILISAHARDNIAKRAIDYGAAGFLSKTASAETIVKAISHVMAGGIWQEYISSHTSDLTCVNNRFHKNAAEGVKQFTAQQFRVAMMLASGLQNKQIAYELEVTEATIKAHLTSIFRKLKVSSRTQAVLALKQLDSGIIE